MSSLNKKTKIIIGVIITIVILYLIYNVLKSNFNIFSEDTLTISNNLALDENISNQNEAEEISKNILVHISGAVNNEGIVELKEGSRVSDAIEKAGGLKDSANLRDINLAEKLEDGVKIYIPTNEEVAKTDENNGGITKYSNGTSGSTSSSSNKNSKININTATQAELDSLPGIGPSTAQKIITYRQENGKFKSIDDLKKVKGIGDSKFNELKDLICV